LNVYTKTGTLFTSFGEVQRKKRLLDLQLQKTAQPSRYISVFFFRSKFGSVRRTDESLDIQGHQRCVLEAMAYSLFRKRIN
jgi:hypothetical protein